MRERAQSLQSAGELALAAIACLVVIMFLVLPVAAILARAADTNFFDVVATSAVTDALRLSLLTTTVSLALVIIFGTPVAYVMARTRFPGHAIVDTLIDLPIVLPPAVGGLGLLLVFGRRGWLGEPLDSLGFELAFSTTAVVMAQMFVASPFYIRAARAGFEAAGVDLEDVARTLGSSRSGTFLRVAVPVAMPALMAGAVMAWARALGEFGATIMFAGSIQGETQTVPLAIYRQFETGIEAPLALSAVLVVVSFSVLLAFRLITRRATFTL